MAAYTVEPICKNPYLHLWKTTKKACVLPEDSNWIVITKHPLSIENGDYRKYADKVTNALSSFIELETNEYGLDEGRFTLFDPSLHPKDSECFVCSSPNSLPEMVDTLSKIDISRWSLTYLEGRPAAIFSDEADAILFKMMS